MAANTPSPQTEQAAYEAYLLDLVTYCELDAKIKREGTDLNRIVAISLESKDEETRRYAGYIQDQIRQNPSFGDIRLVDNSTTNRPNGVTHDQDAFKAYTFHDPASGQYTVSFSGTPGKSWVNNGSGFGPARENVYHDYVMGADGRVEVTGSATVREHMTGSQADASNYISYLAARFQWTGSDQVVVSGHSQGDNNAKTAALRSPYVDACYGFDGQQYSPEAIREMERWPGYGERLKNIHQFRTANNGVDGFGMEIVPAENIYYQKGLWDLSSNPGHIDHLPETRLEAGFGNYVDGRGILGESFNNFSDIVMGLPEGIRGHAAEGIMYLVQGFHGGEWQSAYGNDKTPFEPLWEACLGIAAMGAFLPVAVTGAAIEEYGAVGGLVAALVFAGAAIFLAPIILFAAGAVALIGLVTFALDRLTQFAAGAAQAVRDIAKAIGDCLKTFGEGLQSLYRELFDKGFQYAKSHTSLKLDTGRMREIAGQLERIETRLEALKARYDRQLRADRIYALCHWKFGGPPPQVGRSAAYLNETVERFERAEREIRALFG